MQNERIQDDRFGVGAQADPIPHLREAAASQLHERCRPSVARSSHFSKEVRNL